MYKIGRNEPCPCGSGRKYKQCCFLDPARNEEILHFAVQTNDYEELAALVQQPAKIYRLRVTLDSMGSQQPASPVSRTIEIEGEDTLYDLHLEIQRAFGWDNDHLYSFYMSNNRRDPQAEYAGNPVGEDLESSFGKPPGSASQTELRDLKLRKRKKFKYLFDYGDDLLHTVEVLDIHDLSVDQSEYPRIVERIGEPPPQYEYFED
jgi:hypothetical protein